MQLHWFSFARAALDRAILCIQFPLIEVKIEIGRCSVLDKPSSTGEGRSAFREDKQKSPLVRRLVRVGCCGGTVLGSQPSQGSSALAKLTVEKKLHLQPKLPDLQRFLAKAFDGPLHVVEIRLMPLDEEFRVGILRGSSVGV